MEIITGWVAGIKRRVFGDIIFVDLIDGKREEFTVKKHGLIDKLGIGNLVEITYSERGGEKIVEDIRILRKPNTYIYDRTDNYGLLFRSLTVRSRFTRTLQAYLDRKGFVEINIPVITDTSDIRRSFMKLYSCYLEIALLGFSKVYSFANIIDTEKTDNPRYHHVFLNLVGAVAGLGMTETMDFVENIISDLISNLASFVDENSFNVDMFRPPFYRISYDEAVDIIRKTNPNFAWGGMIGRNEERVLSSHFDRSFWVMYLPRKTQPPLHRLKPDNREKTLTSVLLFPLHGKSVCVAEKTVDIDELTEHITNDGYNEEEFRCNIELRNKGIPRHTQFVVDIEKFLKLVGIHFVSIPNTV